MTEKKNKEKAIEEVIKKENTDVVIDSGNENIPLENVIVELNEEEKDKNEMAEKEYTDIVADIDDKETTMNNECKPKIIYIRKLSTKLLNDKRFSPWLTRSSINTCKAFCKICNHELAGGLTQIIRHGNTKKHQKYLKLKHGTAVTMSVQQSIYSKDVAAGELKLFDFIAEHNLPLALFNHLPGLIANVCPDSKIAKNLLSARQGCGAGDGAGTSGAGKFYLVEAGTGAEAISFKVMAPDSNLDDDD